MQKLKITEYAAIAEIIGTIAIVLSLIFVGYQIHLNTEENRAANRQSLAIRAQELALFSAKYGGGLEPFENFQNLNAEQQAAARAYIAAFLRNVEEAYLSYRDGRLDKEYWLTRAAVAKTLLRTEIAKQFYIDSKKNGLFATDFIMALEAYIDAD